MSWVFRHFRFVKHTLPLACAALVFVGCSTIPRTNPPALPATTAVENLTAFSRIYGNVKYFHPSDEAASLDWQRFAVEGARLIRAAGDRATLLRTLRELFTPIAPTVWIGLDTDTRPPREEPATTAGLQVVAWQHRGDGVDRGSRPSLVYKSVRTNRPEPLAETDSGCVAASLEASVVAGKRVRVKVWVRGADRGMSSVHVIAGVYAPDRVEQPSEYQSQKLSLTSEWTRQSFERDIPADAIYAWAGVCLYYEGAVEVDDLAVDVAAGDSRWTPLPLPDPSFEGWDDQPQYGQTGYVVSAPKTDDAHSGARAAKVARLAGLLPGGMLVEHAVVGDDLTVELGAGLVARVPLALWSDREHTLPHGDTQALTAQLAAVPIASAESADVRLGAVIVAWNAVEHFYPYFDVVDTGWDEALVEALSRALDDQDEHAFAITLEVLLEHLQDGHAIVRHDELRSWDGELPIHAEWVEDQLLITVAADPSVTVGDRVLAVEGQPIDQWRAAQLALTSGSPQRKQIAMLNQLRHGLIGSNTNLQVAGPDGAERSVTLTRIPGDQAPETRSLPSIRSLDDGVFYVDLVRASSTDIEAQLPAIAAAPGVVFDMRGYPNNNDQILDHLLEVRDDHRWMFTQLLSRPRSVAAPNWEAVGWGRAPAEPHIAGDVVFLTDARAISYAESVMGFVDGYQLGAIVGAATAGANGNVKAIELPGAFTIQFTGMKVLRHDGSRLHAVGIPPTHPARRTIEGLRSGRDEVLEAGLQILRAAHGE